MKVLGVITAFVLSVCLLAAPVAAAPESVGAPDGNKLQPQVKTEDKEHKDWGKKEFKKISPSSKELDPVKALQARKEKVQEYLKEGKITKDKADAINAKIDSKIKAIQEFNKLTLPQKKDKLKSDIKAAVEKKVKDGKLTQDKANEVIKEYNEKVENWDGTGRPPFFKKGAGHKGPHGAQGSLQ